MLNRDRVVQDILSGVQNPGWTGIVTQNDAFKSACLSGVGFLGALAGGRASVLELRVNRYLNQHSP
jgi:hypothetical protein